MTDRRKAEQILIEKAQEFASWAKGNPSTMPGVIMDVIEAADALAAIPLELPGAARTNRAAPLTASQAAAWMGGDRAKSVAGRIVRRLYLNWANVTVPKGLTVEELGGKHQTTSARVNELRNAGWIRPMRGITRKTSSGRQAEVYVPTDEALALLRRAEAGEP